jgi:hypothetical protein
MFPSWSRELDTYNMTFEGIDSKRVMYFLIFISIISFGTMFISFFICNLVFNVIQFIVMVMVCFLVWFYLKSKVPRVNNNGVNDYFVQKV